MQVFGNFQMRAVKIIKKNEINAYKIMEKITKTKQSKNNIVDWALVPFSCEKQRMKRSIKSTKHFEFDLYFDKEKFCVLRSVFLYIF